MLVVCALYQVATRRWSLWGSVAEVSQFMQQVWCFLKVLSASASRAAELVNVHSKSTMNRKHLKCSAFTDQPYRTNAVGLKFAVLLRLVSSAG